MTAPSGRLRPAANPEFDWLVVGAGFTGATIAERVASQLGQRVMVVDRRPDVGGNAHDSRDEHGIRVHRYGAHIFHTGSETVWRYLSRFTDWLPYVHRVKAVVDGHLVPVPFNLDALHTLLPREAARLERLLLTTFGPEARVPVLTLLSHPDPALRDLAGFVFDRVYLNYTRKQWGLRPEELDRSVTGRVPIVVSRDDRYFRDPHQGIPRDGYTALIARMLDHPNIRVELGVDVHLAATQVTYGSMVFTGEIDAFFDYAHGPLPYRSLRFDHETVPVPRYQEAAVVNFPNEHAFTRILEHSQFSGENRPCTTITREYPGPYEPGLPYVAGVNEPYYPIPCAENRHRYGRYAAEADDLAHRVVFAGRLAEYRYYDMDQAVAHALITFRDRIAGRGGPVAAAAS